MTTSNYSTKRYTMAMILGVLAGGILVTLAVKTIPRMMSQMMAGMMQNMMARMKESGCSPSEM